MFEFASTYHHLAMSLKDRSLVAWTTHRVVSSGVPRQGEQVHLFLSNENTKLLG